MRFLWVGLIILCSCSREPVYIQELPIGFPEISYPDNNYPSEARIALGKKLFFDTRLSRDSSISCASCHKPHLAFADSVAVSAGVNGPVGMRNSYALLNVAYQESMFMDGGIPTLELQAIAPIIQDTEQNMSMFEAAKRFENDASYQRLSKKAYGEDLTASIITRAIACYERSLISTGSRFDRYYYLNDSDALSDEEKQGWHIFNNEGNCSACHPPFLFTDHTFQNIGVYTEYEDMGRFRITDDSSDVGKFKVPSLRNVALTGPYMHDGSIEDLEFVVDLLNRGGEHHINKSEKIKPLGLDHKQKAALIAFLKCLTDTTLIN